MTVDKRPYPTHGDMDVCTVCGYEIEYVEYVQSTFLGTKEVLDAWWAHLAHPKDGHDALSTFDANGS